MLLCLGFALALVWFPLASAWDVLGLLRLLFVLLWVWMGSWLVCFRFALVLVWVALARCWFARGLLWLLFGLLWFLLGWLWVCLASCLVCFGSCLVRFNSCLVCFGFALVAGLGILRSRIIENHSKDQFAGLGLAALIMYAKP